MKKVAWSPSCAAPGNASAKKTGRRGGGRKSHAELWPEVVAEARRRRREKGKGGRLSYGEIAPG